MTDPTKVATSEKVALVVAAGHEKHRDRKREYLERPSRVASIMRGIEATGWFDTLAPERFEDHHLTSLHDQTYVAFLEAVCATVAEEKSVYAEVFPPRYRQRLPTDLLGQAGYFGTDSFTPLTRGTFLAARAAVDCALTAAARVLSGQRWAYALVRPPGHHAERSLYGGYCYFNNAAVAAHYLSAHGNVAMLDVDFHAGNGQQTLFYDRPDVFTQSIHADPAVEYPHYAGFEDERGAVDGLGFNQNYPLAGAVDGAGYLTVLDAALQRIAAYAPRFLVVPLGFDTAEADPAGGWSLRAKDFKALGAAIASLGLPTVFVQEGGYRSRTLGVNARHFFSGVVSQA